jgi:hypothetical protein
MELRAVTGVVEGKGFPLGKGISKEMRDNSGEAPVNENMSRMSRMSLHRRRSLFISLCVTGLRDIA